jgi:hypothetical protein
MARRRQSLRHPSAAVIGRAARVHGCPPPIHHSIPMPAKTARTTIAPTTIANRSSEVGSSAGVDCRASTVVCRSYSIQSGIVGSYPPRRWATTRVSKDLRNIRARTTFRAARPSRRGIYEQAGVKSVAGTSCGMSSSIYPAFTPRSVPFNDFDAGPIQSNEVTDLRLHPHAPGPGSGSSSRYSSLYTLLTHSCPRSRGIH